MRILTPSSQKSVVLRKLAAGMEPHDVARAAGTSVKIVYTLKSRAKRTGEWVKYKREAENEVFGKALIEILISMKTFGRSDHDIALELEITREQVIALWEKYQDNPEYKVIL